MNSANFRRSPAPMSNHMMTGVSAVFQQTYNSSPLHQHDVRLFPSLECSASASLFKARDTKSCDNAKGAYGAIGAGGKAQIANRQSHRTCTHTYFSTKQCT